ncbi:MAG: GGDEF domain-containing protein [Nitrospirae bacterium]|nr:GGDEF domain-containing protein [Nitrospirota bacterium]
MAGDSHTSGRQYDPQNLLNAQPIVVALINPASFEIQYENQSAVARFGARPSAKCYEKISGSTTPCSFCRMWETAETGRSASAEVPLPNGDYLLFQWSKAETADGEIHIVETITDITDTKKQQQQMQVLNRRLEEINQQLVQHNRRLQERSIRDGLTGLYNHSYFCETLTRTFAQAKRTGNPLSVMFLDLDNFKLVNDGFGHGVGDQVLQAVGRLLASTQGTVSDPPLLRSSDLAARYGGEEFVVLLPDTPLEGALVIAERVRQRMMTVAHQAECAHLGSLGIRVSCSIGVASFPRHVATPSELITAADQAAYLAKAAGKNRVAVYQA